MGHYTYLLIDIFVLAIPLAFSFINSTHFISNLRHTIFGILLGLLIFVPWDIGFTAMKIFSFNSKYLLGIYFFGVPLEECLFYITTPYFYLFIYHSLRIYIKRDVLRGFHFSITPILAIGLGLLLINNFDKTFTAISSAFLILLLLIQLIKLWRYMSWFFISFLLGLIPIAIVNGILTSLHVIEYNDSATLGIKLGTIPIDSFIYYAGLLLLVTMGYEWSKRKFSVTVLSTIEKESKN